MGVVLKVATHIQISIQSITNSKVVITPKVAMLMVATAVGIRTQEVESTTTHPFKSIQPVTQIQQDNIIIQPNTMVQNNIMN